MSPRYYKLSQRHKRERITKTVKSAARKSPRLRWQPLKSRISFSRHFSRARFSARRRNATKLRRHEDLALILQVGSGQVYSRDSIVTRDTVGAFAKCHLPLNEKRFELRMLVAERSTKHKYLKKEISACFRSWKSSRHPPASNANVTIETRRVLNLRYLLRSSREISSCRVQDVPSKIAVYLHLDWPFFTRRSDSAAKSTVKL